MMRSDSRVLHVLSTLTAGGAEINTTRLVATLAGRGFDQVVVSLTPEINPALRSSIDVPFHYPPRRRRLVGSAGYLSEIIRSFEPHLIHGRAFRTWAECVVARTFASSQAALVQSFHGATSLDIQLLRRKIIARFLRNATRQFIAVSHDLASRMTEQWRIPPPKIEVIANGVDVKRFRPASSRGAAKTTLALPSGAFVVGTVGSLREVKNHILLIRAFARYVKIDPSSLLLVVGDGPMRSALESQARSRGIHKQVRFAGHRSAVWKYVQAMDVFVQPSGKEGSPTAVLEAMACGVPVVAARSSGCVELHDKTGLPLLVECDDEHELAARLAELRANGHHRLELSKRCRQVVSDQFSFERMVESYERLYRSTLEVEQGAAARVTA